MNLKQSFLFPRNFGQCAKKVCLLEKCTQTKSADMYPKLFAPEPSSGATNLIFQQHTEDRAVRSIVVDKKRIQSPTFLCKKIRPTSKLTFTRMGTRCITTSNIVVKTHSEESSTRQDDCSLDADDDILNSIDLTARIEDAIDKLQDSFWESNLQGLKGLLEILDVINWDEYDKYLPVINRRLIDLIKSPRSMLVRVACQTVGELFKTSKCFKRLEFDEIVSVLLYKTSDPNRFIQKDANIALDKMVTFIPFCHSVRSLSMEGPKHKHPLVRIATSRLFVCICALAGLDTVLGTESNARCRKRIVIALQFFLRDKCLETRYVCFYLNFSWPKLYYFYFTSGNLERDYIKC